MLWATNVKLISEYVAHYGFQFTYLSQSARGQIGCFGVEPMEMHCKQNTKSVHFIGAVSRLNGAKWGNGNLAALIPRPANLKQLVQRPTYRRN
jgi:hypothetical protein